MSMKARHLQRWLLASRLAEEQAKMNSSVHSRPLVKRRKQLWKTAVFCMAMGALHMMCTSDHPLPGHRINISVRACVESWYWSTLVSGVVSCETKIRKRNHFRLSRLPRRELQRCLRDSRDIVLATPRTEKQGRRRSVALGIASAMTSYCHSPFPSIGDVPAHDQVRNVLLP
jgi:hypothetical protein